MKHGTSPILSYRELSRLVCGKRDLDLIHLYLQRNVTLLVMMTIPRLCVVVNIDSNHHYPFDQIHRVNQPTVQFAYQNIPPIRTVS